MKKDFMYEAMLEAKKAFDIEEVPVGAVIVYNNKIIARAHNEKEKNKCAIDHAEMLAIKKACSKLGDWRLNECELYVTLQPCLMCYSAIKESRINKIYYCLNSNEQMYDIDNDKYFKCDESLIVEQCKELMKSFFDNQRKKL